MEIIKKKERDASSVHPYIPELHHENIQMKSVEDVMEAVRQSDCVVIVTNHKWYDYPAILENANSIVDTRNALGKLGRGNQKVFTL